MAMTRVCDVCGKPVRAPFKQIKVLKADSDDQEPKNYKTVKSLDFHESCFGGFTEWLRKTRETSLRFNNSDANVADIDAKTGQIV